MRRARYFLNRATGRLYLDRHAPGRFTGEPERYRELSAGEYAALTAIRAQFLGSMRPYLRRHAGATVHVFGNGPSLNDFAAKQDWSAHVTLGVNAAGLHIRPLRYWLTVDNLVADGRRDLYDWLREWLESVRGRTATFTRFGAPLVLREPGSASCQLAPRNLTDCATNWLPDAMFAHAPFEPLEDIEDGLYWNSSSVQAALDLARHMGARRAILWGVDYHDRRHAYTGSAAIPRDPLDNPGTPWANWERIVHGFETVKAACAASGLEILNANPNSRLTVFPFVKPEAAFAAPPVAQAVSLRAQPDRLRYAHDPEAAFAEGTAGAAGAPARGPSAGEAPAAPALAAPPLVVIFFTSGTSYEALAQDAVAAFARFGLEVRAVPYANAGDWMKNALARAPLLAEIAAGNPDRVVGLLDADVRPLARPEKLFALRGDFACEDRGARHPAHNRYSAGVLLFGPTPLGRKLLAVWAARCREDAEPGQFLREQKYLHDAVEALRRDGLALANLGNAYNRLPEQRREGDDTVLLHAPASRRTLAEIGGRR